MSVVKYKYIPGTKVPSMGTKRVVQTEAAARAGFRARTQGMTDTLKSINVETARAIAKAASPVRDFATIWKAIEEGALVGYIESVKLIRRDMDKTPPLIPVSAGGGTLRSSWFARPIVNGVLAGFSADYAPYVHEMTSPPYGVVKWTRPGSGPKFLEEALKRNAQIIPGIVAKHVKAKIV